MANRELETALTGSVAQARTDDGEDAVGLTLDWIMGKQRAASRACAKHPLPALPDEPEGPEIGFLPGGSDSEEDAEFAADFGPVSEAQERARDHAEEHDWERALGRGED